MGNILELYGELGTYKAVGDRLGISRQAATKKIKKALLEYPDKLPSSKEPLPSKPVDTIRVLYFTDAHNQPDMPIDRFKWLASLCNELDPDILFDGGDGDDINSLCAYEKNESYKGKLKPSLARDLEAAAQMRATINKYLLVKPRKIITLGNHEDRIWRFENDNPEMHGIPTAIYTKDILEASGWEWHPYREYVNIGGTTINGVTYGGVDFVHVPMNKRKEYEGENAVKQVTQHIVRDIVFGHIHELQFFQMGKVNNHSVTAYCGGCFMPQNYIPSYCKYTRKEFWYGAHLITIKDGRIRDIKQYTMRELEEKYG